MYQESILKPIPNFKYMKINQNKAKMCIPKKNSKNSLNKNCEMHNAHAYNEKSHSNEEYNRE